LTLIEIDRVIFSSFDAAQLAYDLDRQTGQLLPMPVKMSAYAAQNVACRYRTEAMPEHGAFTQSS